MKQVTVSQYGEASAEALFAMFASAMAEQPGPFRDREAGALRLANEMVRRWMQGELSHLSARYEDEVMVDGNQYRRHASGLCQYHSLCGAVEVRRDSYRLVGTHNGPTVIPLEIEAGIHENATPALASSVLQGFATMPLRQYEDEMREAYRVAPSRSTLERIGKRLGAAIRDQASTLEAVVRQTESLPPGARSISVGLDRTSVPMAEPAPDRRTVRTKPYVRRAPAPVTVAYRMAYVATLAVHDDQREVIKSIRITATAEEGPAVLMTRLGAELQHLRAQGPRLPLVAVQDGAPELWNLLEDWLKTLGEHADLKLIDRYHVDERLAEACHAIDPVHGDRLLQRWRAALDRSSTAMRNICKRLHTLTYGSGDEDLPWAAQPPQLRGERARIVEGHLTYFTRDPSRFDYASARRRGFPIGSGVTEGACKSAVGARFKRSGQRWLESGVSPCLHLRSMSLNGRLSAVLRLYTDVVRRSLA